MSEIGYGAWGIGGAQWGGADDDDSIAALNHAIDLGVNFIDTALAYVWNDAWADQGDWRDAVEVLRSTGAIRFFGVSINDHEPANSLRMIRSGAADTVQVIYNVFDQSPEDELFGACRQHDVGVIARVPLDEGGLTGTLKPDRTVSADRVRPRHHRG